MFFDCSVDKFHEATECCVEVLRRVDLGGSVAWVLREVGSESRLELFPVYFAEIVARSDVVLVMFDVKGR